ncbi:MAG: hypothetical protein IJT30_11740 [Muribaculaceae bacterium]|nr:hypothetical protein [Muribaculaceae bacterium]
MIKALLKYRVLACAVCLIVCASSCGGDSPADEPNQPVDPVTPVTPTTDQAMTPDEQKNYLEQVALEFMELTPSSDFMRISDLGCFIRDTYGDRYDWDEVGDWARGLWETSRSSLGSYSQETSRWGYNYVFYDYTALLLASNFTGHFTARNGYWQRTDASDLQFLFNDQAGAQCVVKLTTSGSIKKVHAFNLDEYKEYRGGTEYYDRVQCTVGVPENIEVTLTQGGNLVVKTTVKVDLNSLSGEEFDISRSAFNVSSTTELNNGYRFALSQAVYKANNQVSLTLVMSKGSRTLATMAFSSDLSGIPACNASAFASEDFDIDNYNTDAANANAPFVKLDILGKVQIQGRVTDARKLADNLELADENSTNEYAFKDAIAHTNEQTDLNLFYNGTATKQATIKLEPFVEDYWNGRTYWDAEPVIVFFDGSSYSTVEAFFNETSFKRTIDTFKRLSNSYAALIDEHINW